MGGNRPTRSISSEISNDHIADVRAPPSGTFCRPGTIPAGSRSWAVSCNVCVSELGLSGDQIGARRRKRDLPNERHNLDSDRLNPVWSAAEQKTARDLRPPWDMVGKERMPKILAGPGLLACRRGKPLSRFCSMISEEFRAVPLSARRFRAWRWRLPAHDGPD